MRRCWAASLPPLLQLLRQGRALGPASATVECGRAAAASANGGWGLQPGFGGWRRWAAAEAAPAPREEGGEDAASQVLAKRHFAARQKRRNQRTESIAAEQGAVMPVPGEVGAEAAAAGLAGRWEGPSGAEQQQERRKELSERVARHKRRHSRAEGTAEQLSAMPVAEVGVEAAAAALAGGRWEGPSGAEQQQERRNELSERAPRRKRRRKRAEIAAAAEPEAGAAEGAGVQLPAAPAPAAEALPLPPMLILQDDAHPIRQDNITRAAWIVLARLRAAGHEAYVVGGAIRDLLLGGTPKDYDILTSAEPAQIRKIFARCFQVGRSFPVCHVHMEGMVLEVSSFCTKADAKLIPADASAFGTGRQKKRAGHGGKGALWAAARSENAVRRDFTVNALLYDPFGRLLFDCVGGVADCGQRVLRTICDPTDSFQEDPARILRGVRLAARAGLRVHADTARALERLGPLAAQLPAGRLQMELGALMGYGAAAGSVALLWRFGLLDLLLPQHALYFRQHRVARRPRREPAHPDLLTQLLQAADAHAHPQRALDPCVWVALLAAPLVAADCQQVRDAAAKASRRRGRRSSKGSSEASAGDASSNAGTDGAGVQEAAQTEDQLLQYRQIVADVLDRMLQPLDADTLGKLGSSARVDEVLDAMSSGASSSAGRRKQRQRDGGGDGGGEGEEGSVGLLLPSLLPKSAVERAGRLLLAEASLRGTPDLAALLEEERARRHGQQHRAAPGGSREGGQPAPGSSSKEARSARRRERWERRRRRRAAGFFPGVEADKDYDSEESESEGEEEEEAAAAAAAVAARMRRKWAPEERLVLSLLAEFDWPQRVRLA